MPDRWYDERGRRRDARRGRDYDDYEQMDYGPAEDRHFGPAPGRYAARRTGQDRDHVFGERETTETYTGEPYRGRSRYAPGSGYERPPAYERDRREESYYGRGLYPGDDWREQMYRDVYGRKVQSPRDIREGEFSHFGFGFDPLSGYTYEAQRPMAYEGGRRTPNVRGGRDDHHERNWLERARDEVSSWFGDEDAERRREWDAANAADHRGRGPLGYKRSDERILEDAHDRLTDHPWLDATGIHVSVSAGEVTLAGTVSEREAKHRAERIVENISGVEHVQNNLRVHRGEAFTRPAAGYGDGAPSTRAAGSPLASSSGTGLASSTASDATGSNGGASQGARGKSAN